MERKIGKNLVVAAFAVLAVQGAAHAQEKKTDIVGIQLGMSADEVRTLMKKHDPAMKIMDAGEWETKNGIPASLAVITGCTGGNLAMSGTAECKDLIQVTFGHTTKKALHIHRKIRLKDNILVDNAVSGLFEKYGQPTEQFQKNSSSFNWIYDASGKPAARGGNLDRDKCEATTYGMIQGAGLNCGIAIHSAVSSLDKKYTDGMEVDMQDARLIKEERQNFIKISKENDKSKQDSLKDVKPKL